MTNTEKKYKFSRADFPPLATKPQHMDMLFDMHQDRVKVTAHTTFKHTAPTPLSQLNLNAKKLEVHEVARVQQFSPLNGGKDFPAHVASFENVEAINDYEVDTEKDYLRIKFEQPIQQGEEFVIKTVTTATPTANVLEGLYFDYTPEGAPKTIITQCQQYGFQRIVPALDEMDSKAYYTTTIIADKGYSNIITNGDLAPGFVDESGTPIYHPSGEVLPEDDPKRHYLKFYNHTVNMATYLFFLGVGTYHTYRRTLEFADGKTTLLELVTLPGRADVKDATEALSMLHDSIQWVNVSLGPEATKHCEERKKIYELLTEREDLKAKQSPLVTGPHNPNAASTELSAVDASRLSTVRSELKDLIGKWNKTGYQYTGAVYREIGMENSYYGGMENVGNTTIVQSCLCPNCHMDDQSYEYMERVKVHEYYHNINGSEVTGATPFEIWLNEAVTVHMERKRHCAIFGVDYCRLNDVRSMFRPAIGPLPQDKLSTSMAIEPEGFNQSQELVSAVTYSKAPEFIRMVELILGNEQFDINLDQYYTKYHLGNASSMQWLECMQGGGFDFSQLAKTWLKRPGYPDVTYSTSYDDGAKEYRVKISQTGFENLPDPENRGPWEIPVDWALVKDGKVTKEGVYRFVDATGELVITDVSEKPDFLSFARGWSFFGTTKQEGETAEMQRLQAKTDPDMVNRYFAFRRFADTEKERLVRALVKGEKPEVSQEYISVASEILFDTDSPMAWRAATVSETSALTNDELSFHYKEVGDATKAMRQALWFTKGSEIMQMYENVKQESHAGPHKDQMHLRHMKRLLLSLMVYGSAHPLVCNVSGTSVVSMLEAEKNVIDVLENSTFASDQTIAFSLIMCTEQFPDREKIRAKVYDEWKKEPTMLEKYIMVLANLDASDVPSQLRRLVGDEAFDINLANHTRSIARGLSQIRQWSLMSDDGLELVVELFGKFGKVNEMSTYPLLKIFGDMKKFDQEHQEKFMAALKKMQGSIDAKSEESLYNQLNIMIKA